MEKEWSGLTPEAGRAYKQRVNRFIDAVNLKEPDRVPVVLPSDFFPAVLLAPYGGGISAFSEYGDILLCPGHAAEVFTFGNHAGYPGGL